MYYYQFIRSKTMDEEKPKIVEETPTIIDETPRKVGAQPGNHNARIHGFYAKELDETEKLEYEQAIEVDGLDSEIALLRVKIKSLVTRDPENLKLITQATNALARLIMTKYNIGKSDKPSLKEAVGNVLKDIALPFGIGIGTGLIK
jgi:hypothetical protein